MTILVAGASGATGRLLVEQLLAHGHSVKAIVRSPDRLPDHLRHMPHLTVITASLLNLTDDELTGHAANCGAVASCLGHNLTWRGVYGEPRKLVADATRRLCRAARVGNTGKKIKFVLMNTTGVTNHDLQERVPLSQSIVTGFMRWILPPHTDNEQAADYLRVKVGQNDPQIEWVAVRPDGLIDEDEVSNYSIHPSPIRNPIFDAGKTSRINVAHFMARLLDEEVLWKQWKGQMPVIYNKEEKAN
jgi:nucleoside-diphosphate-sugar epimerase